MKPKKIPLRMCLGCMEMKPKKDLIRVVKNKDGEVSLDMVEKSPAGEPTSIKISVVWKRLLRQSG